MTETNGPAATLFQQFMELRDRQRKQREGALTAIRSEQVEAEVSPLGNIRWYMHPLLQGRAINSLIMYEQTIRPGGRGARIRFQGGAVAYVISGKGHTVIDGEVYPWEDNAVIQLPLRPEGITYQHFNDDEENPARLLCAEPNTVDALGIDRGSGFDLLEAASDGQSASS